MSEGYAIDNNALAKSYPLEDIQTHTNILLENLFLLKNLHPQLFLKWDRLYDLLEVACIYHDLGKLYPMFQQAIKNKTHHTGEVPHGVLSLAFIDYKWLKKQGFSKDDLDGFGNLALITVSGNSKFSNLPPEGKITSYPSIIEQSLKLKIMKELVNFDDEKWTEEKARKHKEEMFRVLKG
jgi:CRISPR-associated endonuclease Cas3-HD